MWYIIHILKGGIYGWSAFIGNDVLQEKRIVYSNGDYRVLKSKLKEFGIELPSENDLILMVQNGPFKSFTTEQYLSYYSLYRK